MTKCKYLKLMLALMTLLLPAIPAPGADNAKFIRAEIPDSLISDQVFDAKLYFKNTGTANWGNGAGETAVTLVSQNPKFNLNWGTYFIILGQGKTVPPGDTFAFSSPLKAPSVPGLYSMAWQCQNWISWDTTKPFFGETGVKGAILVRQRPGTPPPAPVHRDSLLDTSDFEYAGSFRLPNLPGEEDLYTESGLALRTVGAARHLLLRTGTYDYRLYEIAIPALVKIINNAFESINTASTVRDWGDLGFGTVNKEPVVSNCGFWFDDSSNQLYWSHYNGYFTGGPLDFPQLMSTRLNSDGTKTNVKYWYIPASTTRYKGFWGGPLRLTKRFADAWTGGREMALGFGGYYSICGSASRGPALAAIARPSMNDSVLDLVEMVTYPDPVACPRQGNYLPQVGFWNDYPASPWEGKWTYNDYCRAGVFIDLPDKQGYVAFVQQVTGRIGYDYGGYNTDGHTQNCWYFYDLRDLGKAAKGLTSPASVKPSSFSAVRSPAGGGFVTGACFDTAARLVYLYEQWGLGGRNPVVHAYYVKKGNPAAAQNRLSGMSPVPFDIECTRSSATGIAIRVKGAGLEVNRSRLIICAIDGKVVVQWDLAGRAAATGIIWNPSIVPKGLYIVNATAGGVRISKKLAFFE